MCVFSRGRNIPEMHRDWAQGFLKEIFSSSPLPTQAPEVKPTVCVCECRGSGAPQAAGPSLEDMSLWCWDLGQPVKRFAPYSPLFWSEMRPMLLKAEICLWKGNVVVQALTVWVRQQIQNVSDQRDVSHSLAAVMRGSTGYMEGVQKWGFPPSTSWRTWPHWANKLSQIEIFSLNNSLAEEEVKTQLNL